ncbi:MAG: hypothetical protein FJ098_04910 [Deltaproteobacteria bacterium]|nr:hypothetical protein [Deltaproteobacteria bacterium]
MASLRPCPLRHILLLLVALLCGCCAAHPPAAPDTGAPREDPDRREPPSEGVAAVLGGAYLPTLRSLVAGAREELLAVHFELNDDDLGDAVVEELAAAAGRGVRVRVLLEGDVDANTSRVAELRGRGVEAKLDGPARYTHAKLVVVDRRAALLGSTNWSWMSVHRNNEADVLVTDPVLAGFFAQVAGTLWAAPAAAVDAPVTRTSNGVALSDGDYVPHAQELIAAAQTRICLIVYGLNPNPRYPDSDVFQLLDALAAARDRGADVRVILEWAGYGAEVNEVNELAVEALLQRGLAVRFDPADVITHAKVLLADDEAIVGSNNWGHGGFHLYHEVGLRTAEPTVVTALEAFCDGLWEAGVSPSG